VSVTSTATTTRAGDERLAGTRADGSPTPARQLTQAERERGWIRRLGGYCLKHQNLVIAAFSGSVVSMAVGSVTPLAGADARNSCARPPTMSAYAT